ncbi:MAG: NFACT family protein, partial [Thermoplasmata archaeon]|nr:NFACT family protein [Thermoplasmata archaeon]
MKTQLSSFDIAALVREFQQCIGLRVEKIFLKGYDELFIRLSIPGEKKTISIKLGQAMWLDDGFRTSKSVEPPAFAMLLRKHMSGKAIKSITQHEFDRIVIFEFETEANIRLIAEMFGGGNLILISENKIIKPLTSKSWRAREVKAGYDYQFPPESANPFRFSQEEIMNILKNSQKDLVRCLAMELNLGGAYAEEICHSLARDKKDKTTELSDEEILETYEIIQSFKDMLDEPQSQIILDDEGLQLDVLPFELSMHANLDKKEYDIYSQAVKEYFANLPENIVEEGPQKSQRQLQLERQLANQLEAIGNMEIQAKEYQEIGDKTYANYGLLDGLLNRVNKMLSDGNWQAVRPSILELDNIADFNPADGMLITLLEDGTKILLDVRLSLNDNASLFYEKSKKAKHKLEGAGVAVEETRKLLKGAEKTDAAKHESGSKKPT